MIKAYPHLNPPTRGEGAKELTGLERPTQPFPLVGGSKETGLVVTLTPGLPKSGEGIVGRMADRSGLQS